MILQIRSFGPRCFLWSFTLAALVAAAAGGSRAETVAPHNAPIEEDAVVTALARKAIGTKCTFSESTYGPQVAGFKKLQGVGQLTLDDQTVVIRQRGPWRVAFLAIVTEKSCRVAAAQVLPMRVKGEMFEDCQVDDPDPNKIPPLSRGVGLKQPGSKGLATYIEVASKQHCLVTRSGDDQRINCTGFESGD